MRVARLYLASADAFFTSLQELLLIFVLELQSFLVGAASVFDQDALRRTGLRSQKTREPLHSEVCLAEQNKLFSKKSFTLRTAYFNARSLRGVYSYWRGLHFLSPKWLYTGGDSLPHFSPRSFFEIVQKR